MKNTIIIGAGGFAKSLYGSLTMFQKRNIIGFVDDNKIGKFGHYSILGKISDLPMIIKRKKVKYFIIAIGDPKTRVRISEYCLRLGLVPKTIIDRSANIAKQSIIGEGAYIGKNAIVNVDAKIEKYVIINSGVIIEHGTQVGAYTNISPHCTLAGSVKVGTTTYIGASSTIFQLKEVGSTTIIGAGSIVNRDIPSNVKAFGVPIKIKEDL